jgi:hypothetical protein
MGPGIGDPDGPEVGFWEVGHSSSGFAYFRRMTD